MVPVLLLFIATAIATVVFAPSGARRHWAAAFDPLPDDSDEERERAERRMRHIVQAYRVGGLMVLAIMFVIFLTQR